jgi:uncharacterized membrane protein
LGRRASKFPKKIKKTHKTGQTGHPLSIMSDNNHFLPKNFIVCGLTGWCMEILFTSAQGLLRHDKKLLGQTSVWMFPIYGCACIIRPLYQRIGRLPVSVRGGIYACGILTGEYISGSLLKKHDCCPWDYSDARLGVRGLIRLDYAPLWSLAGLVFERILGCSSNDCM